MAILSYVIAGALAAVAFFLVVKPLAPAIRRLAGNRAWQSNGPMVLAILAAAAVFVAVFLAMGGGKSGGQASQEAEVLDQIHQYRFVQVLEKYRPETRDRLVAIVHNAFEQHNPALAQIQTTQLMQEYFPQYVPRTSDKAIVAFGTSLVDLFGYFETNSPETCKSLATGGTLTQGLTPERMNPTLDAMADVIEDGASKPQDPPDQAKAQALVSGVIEKMYAGTDPELLPMTALATPASQPAGKLCHTMRSFYRTVLTLPPADASIVLRKLISSTK